MTDAILFSASPSMVDVDDARRHLEDHKELYWTVGFPIVKSQFSFPIFGFIHIVGGQVEYRALIADIVPFSAKHYEAPSLKPEAWRERFKSVPNERAWRHNLVMTEIVPFSFDTYRFEKCGGGLITHPPQGYVQRDSTEPAAVSLDAGAAVASWYRREASRRLRRAAAP